jgi:hypothetical protein
MINIFIDIETLPTSNQAIKDRLTANVTAPGNYKKPESIAEWMATEGEKAKQDAINKTALDGTWGELLMIGLAVNDGPVQLLTRSGNEGQLLFSFGGLLDDLCKKETAIGGWQSSATWIGHNLIDFDLRFLWQRSKVWTSRLPFKLPVGKPNYNSGPFVFDTMKEWSGYGGRIKQTDLELAFGIARSDEITGANVAQMYADGKIDVIENHCRQDVENLRAIYRRMTT